MPNMSDPKDPTKIAEPTPEQLLKLLDLQIAAQRARRQEAPGKRASLLVGGLIVIIGGALLALLFLQQMIADLPPQGAGFVPAGTTQHSQ